MSTFKNTLRDNRWACWLALACLVVPMIIFASFGVVAFVMSFLLKIEDRKKGYGLELPNIKK